MTAPVLQLPVKVLRSATAGRRPGDGTFRALADGELFINTQDRVACMLDASGSLFAWPVDPNVLATQSFVTGNFGTGAPSMAGTAATGSATTASRSDHVHSTDTSRAPLASPAFTGAPTAPTPSAGDSSTKLATTGFVLANFAAASPTMAGTASAGSATTAARSDHVHPIDASRAKAGANSDITSLSGLTTALSVGQGGTGGTTAANARSSLGAAASGANADVTSLAGLTSRPNWSGGTLFDTGNVSLSKAANGYVKYPNGLIVQWGVAGGASSGNNSTSFNQGFPNASSIVLVSSTYNATGGTAQAVAVAVQSHDTGGFQWTSRYYNGGFNADNNSVNWLAIGY